MSQYAPGQRNPQGFPTRQRPGLVTFAAVMLLLLFGLYAVSAIMEFFAGTWLVFSPSSVPGGRLWIWGIVDVFFALILLYAAFDILRGGEVGRMIGITIALFSAIRWFFYLPAAPWIGVVVIALDILIIYALVSHSEYFNASEVAG